MDMKWCSSIVGKELVKFIYTGEMEEKFVKEEYLHILKFGDMYNIDSMKEVAEQEMLETLNEENMIHRFIEGDLYRAQRIKESAKDLIKINVKKVMEMQNWKELFGTNKDLIIELLEGCIVHLT